MMFTDKCIKHIIEMPDNSEAETLLVLLFSDKVADDPDYLTCSFNAWNYISDQVNKKLGFNLIKKDRWEQEWEKASIRLTEEKEKQRFDAFKRFMQMPLKIKGLVV